MEKDAEGLLNDGIPSHIMMAENTQDSIDLDIDLDIDDELKALALMNEVRLEPDHLIKNQSFSLETTNPIAHSIPNFSSAESKLIPSSPLLSSLEIEEKLDDKLKSTQILLGDLESDFHSTIDQNNSNSSPGPVETQIQQDQLYEVKEMVTEKKKTVTSIPSVDIQTADNQQPEFFQLNATPARNNFENLDTELTFEVNTDVDPNKNEKSQSKQEDLSVKKKIITDSSPAFSTDPLSLAVLTSPNLHPQVHIHHDNDFHDLDLDILLNESFDPDNIDDYDFDQPSDYDDDYASVFAASRKKRETKIDIDTLLRTYNPENMSEDGLTLSDADLRV